MLPRGSLLLLPAHAVARTRESPVQEGQPPTDCTVQCHSNDPVQCTGVTGHGAWVPPKMERGCHCSRDSEARARPDTVHGRHRPLESRPRTDESVKYGTVQSRAVQCSAVQCSDRAWRVGVTLVPSSRDSQPDSEARARSNTVHRPLESRPRTDESVKYGTVQCSDMAWVRAIAWCGHGIRRHSPSDGRFGRHRCAQRPRHRHVPDACTDHVRGQNSQNSTVSIEYFKFGTPCHRKLEGANGCAQAEWACSENGSVPCGICV
jgi:hypothetical protein